MIDTHWLENPVRLEVDYNNLTAAMFELHDIKAALSQKVLNQTYNADFEDQTIESGLNAVIEFLQTLEGQL